MQPDYHSLSAPAVHKDSDRPAAVFKRAALLTLLLAASLLLLLGIRSANMSAESQAAPETYKYVLFSDLDGTIVHFKSELEGIAEIKPIEEAAAGDTQKGARPNVMYTDLATKEQRLCYTLPSSTAGDAYVSVRTHELVAQLRQAGVLYVVITAGRKSTLLGRVPMLPYSDAYVGEAGGRVLLNTGSQLLYPDTAPADPAPAIETLALDPEWGAKFVDTTGPLDDATAPEDRKGLLWDMYRQVTELGFAPDAKSYWACFRVDSKKCVHPPEKAQELLQQTIESLPTALAYTYNLGKLDIYPAVSGKGGAAKYLMSKFGLQKASSFAIFDDDNDLPMAAEVGQGYVVRALTKSVEDAVLANPHWQVASNKGVLATEEMLLALLQKVQE